MSGQNMDYPEKLSLIEDHSLFHSSCETYTSLLASCPTLPQLTIPKQMDKQNESIKKSNSTYASLSIIIKMTGTLGFQVLNLHTIARFKLPLMCHHFSLIMVDILIQEP